jgi:hypothetical protein
MKSASAADVSDQTDLRPHLRRVCVEPGSDIACASAFHFLDLSDTSATFINILLFYRGLACSGCGFGIRYIRYIRYIPEAAE